MGFVHGEGELEALTEKAKPRRKISPWRIAGVLAIPLSLAGALGLSCINAHRAAERIEPGPLRHPPSPFYITHDSGVTFAVKDADHDGTADYLYRQDAGGYHSFMICREGITEEEAKRHNPTGARIYVLNAEGSAKLQEAYESAIKNAIFLDDMGEFMDGHAPTYEH